MGLNNLAEDSYIGPYKASTGKLYAHQEYPKWVHHVSGASQIIESDEAYQALGDGWFDTKAQAQAALDDDDDESDPFGGNTLVEIINRPRKGRKSKGEKELDALLTKADELGIEVLEDWTVATLRDEVAKAEA